MHSILEYAYLQLGKTNEARDIIGQIDQTSAARGGDPCISIDARCIYFDVETHAWSDAVAIDPPPNSPFDENSTRIDSRHRRGSPR